MDVVLDKHRIYILSSSKFDVIGSALNCVKFDMKRIIHIRVHLGHNLLKPEGSSLKSNFLISLLFGLDS